MPTSLIAAGIGAAGSILGGMSAADGAKAAAAAQAEARRQNAATEAPWINGGQSNFNLYNNATGANGRGAQEDYYNNFQTDPGYGKVLQAGTNAISNSAAARGTLYGGNTLRDINDYGGGLLQGAYNDRMNRLYNGATVGANAANALVGQNTAGANNQGNYLNQSGLNMGKGITGATNALIGGYNNYNYNQRNQTTPNGYSANPQDYGGINYTDNYANMGSSPSW